MSVLETKRRMTSREQLAYDLGFHEGRNAATIHGRWALIETQSSPFGVDQEYQCSICGTPADYEDLTRYCPNCGARMDLEV